MHCIIIDYYEFINFVYLYWTNVLPMFNMHDIGQKYWTNIGATFDTKVPMFSQLYNVGPMFIQGSFAAWEAKSEICSKYIFSIYLFHNLILLGDLGWRCNMHPTL